MFRNSTYLPILICSFVHPYFHSQSVSFPHLLVWIYLYFCACTEERSIICVCNHGQSWPIVQTNPELGSHCYSQHHAKPLWPSKSIMCPLILAYNIMVDVQMTNHLVCPYWKVLNDDNDGIYNDVWNIRPNQHWP